MIELNSVTKRFGAFTALDQLDMRVPAGSVYGLLGPNGAGKSTIIRHLAGIYLQDEGEISIQGQSVWANPALKEKIAYIPDDVFYFFGASTRDMMRFYKGLYPRFDMDLYARLREVFPVGEKKLIRNLSKGMQKQSAFWLALCKRPEILILDEPVDGLDPVMRRRMWSLIMESVAAEGTTVVISSHNLREMEDVCDHVGILDHGCMRLERALVDIETDTVKVQLAMPDGKIFDCTGLNVLNSSRSGKIETFVIRGDKAEIKNNIAAQEPGYYDLIPLSLEEIFIYELGGDTDAIKDILL